tara:strand:+ start:307 stop:477 length:171 start_codon:yes stop_codon:yes gene_type:complete
MGLLKYIVKLPKEVIKIQLINGTLGIFFSKIHIMINAIIVAIINGGIATFRSFPPL